MSNVNDVDLQQFSNEALYEFSIYPFGEDSVFQEGLHSIVSSAHGRSQGELDDIIGQAKVFYFTRTTGHRLTWGGYVEWKKTHPSPFPNAPVDTPRETTAPPTLPAAEDSRLSEPLQLSFQQITELIKSGNTDLIPNNKIIPEALHPDPPSESSGAARKKPWEGRESAETT